MKEGLDKEWKQMQDIWSQTNPGGPNVDQILSYVVERSQRFDRRVRWRNLREWLGAAVGLGGAAFLVTKVKTPVEIAFVLSMSVLVIGVSVHLWVKGRSEGQVDPSLSRDRFRASLEAKFGKQIRMLRLAKYWFLIPLLAIGGTTAWTYLQGEPGPEDWFYFPLALVGSALAWWLNDAGAVRGVEREWERVRRALDDGEMP